MAIEWPVSLQQLLNVESFSYRVGSTVLTSDVDVGPIKKRRRFTRPVDTLSCSINLPIESYDEFMTFFNTTINGGVTPFEFDHPITQVPTLFRFVGEPDLRPLGGTVFSLSMEWEVLP